MDSSSFSYTTSSKICFEARELLIRIVKYSLEGLVVAIAAFYLSEKRLSPEEIVVLGLIAAAMFALLDTFARPVIGGGPSP